MKTTNTSKRRQPKAKSIGTNQKRQLRINQLTCICIVITVIGILIMCMSLLPLSSITLAAKFAALTTHQIFKSLNILNMRNQIIFPSSDQPLTAENSIDNPETNNPTIASTVLPTVNPRIQPPRLLYMTASYTLDQIDYLTKAIQSLRDICNAGWDITIHIQVSNGLSYNHPTYKALQDTLFCEYLNKKINIALETYDKIGFGLNSRHRLVMKDLLNEFDYFVYAEEDMILTPSHLSSYLEAMLRFKTHLPRTWLRYYVGFLRLST